MKKLNKKHIEDILFLTPMQEGILFHYLKEPGDIDATLFEKAWQLVIKNNQMLRTLFRWENVKQPVQIILKQHHLQPEYHDLSNLECSEKEKKLEKIKTKDRQKKFNLHEVPFRVTQCKIKDGRVSGQANQKKKYRCQPMSPR